jgi:hypothetical protein
MSCNLYKNSLGLAKKDFRLLRATVTFNLDGSGLKTKWITSVLFSFMAVGAIHGSAHAFDLPKEVTPAIRAACERDVRRLCVRANSTLSSVKTCVVRKFDRLNFDCRFRLMQAGL